MAKRRVFSLVSLLVAAALLAACNTVGAGNGEAVEPELIGTAWQLVTLNGHEPLADTTITLEFTETDLMGEAGCNQYTASYELEGDVLTVGDIIRTQMACLEPEGLMEQEDTYLAALGNVATVRQADGQLEMLDSAGNVLLTYVER